MLGHRFAPLVAFAALFFAGETGLRIALLGRVWSHVHPSPGSIARILVAGSLSDAVALPWGLPPAARPPAGLPARLHASRPGRALVHAGYGIAAFAVLFSLAAEWLFW